MKGSKEELTEYLKGLVKECLNYPEELKEMREEMEEAEKSSKEFLKNNPHLIKKKQGN